VIVEGKIKKKRTQNERFYSFLCSEAVFYPKF